MTTYTIFADATDGWIEATNATHATALTGVSATINTTGSLLVVGQLPTYFVEESFVSFDTSPIDDAETVSAVTFSLDGTSDQSVTDFTTNARLYDWSPPFNSYIDSSTTLLLHGDGTDASTTITDSARTPHTMTVGGAAQIDTAQSKFGGASILFDGANDWVETPDSADWNFGANDFTIDMWARPNAIGSVMTMISQDAGAGTDRNWVFNITATGFLQFILRNAAGTAVITMTDTTTALSAGTWYHVAAERFGSSGTLFVNGVAVFGAAASGTGQDSTTKLIVGARNQSGATAGQGYNGWLDEIRISKGIARYGAANFTPETVAYPAIPVEWQTPAALASLPLMATFASAGYSAAYNDFTSDAAFPAAVNKTGATRLIIASSRFESSTQPSGNEYIQFSSADVAGTTSDPKLVVTAAVASSGHPTMRRWGGSIQPIGAQRIGRGW